MYLEIFQTASAENGLGVTLTGICDTFSSLIWDNNSLIWDSNWSFTG